MVDYLAQEVRPMAVHAEVAQHFTNFVAFLFHLVNHLVHVLLQLLLIRQLLIQASLS